MLKREVKKGVALVAPVIVLVSELDVLRYFRIFQNQDVKYFNKTLIELQLLGL